ncbi:DUF3618 domain-containing protein [Rhizobium sp. P32RR-XVIII]|uniref:DUF3618 domain-containing protein n=1 Tax=Rhizobium sp. P32RR-XVIII TaxID=2726738 RepID=UPI001456304F|nr:DUF3618 domain-containing protein [Rhizobium sp. P32RR-XVIII]NLS06375.1 DUF3618 domain-containing protein [Rhizobium sp. P32RR-XVIII]
MANSIEKTSSDLQREIDADRQRIGDRIDAIQERMSPGQLIDEVLVYAKSSGGGEYVRNLGQALKDNPLPVALMGISLAWLMAKQQYPSSSAASSSAGLDEDEDYPLYQVEGPVRRIGPPETENGVRYSHFADTSGKRLKAITDDAGRRAGHFMDDAGKTYRGFADATGRQIVQIVDETGAMFDAASGWASKTWAQVKGTASNIGTRASDAASSISESSTSAGASMQQQASKLNDAILTHFRDQPLVGGALAFAVGAAIGAALPHTETEDEYFGEAADAAKDTVAIKASSMMDQGTEIASDVYSKTVSAASDVHDAAKAGVVEEADAFKSG